MNIKSIKKWHLLLLWPALIACIIYVVSAFTHPLMAWTGPQAKVMFPPALASEKIEVNNITAILAAHDLGEAKIAKLVPYQQETLLQVTENETSARRYFSLSSKRELTNHDEKQAIWLAEHFLKQSLPIESIQLKIEFDESYPSVNRLLPVYKIHYKTSDHLSVYIHTDTQALAGIENDWKRSLRFIFQTFHSFEWLNNIEPLRLLIISLLTVSLFLMSVTGLLYLIKLKRKKPASDFRQRWHRRLAWLAVIPLFMFSFSGFYHLWKSSMTPPATGMLLTQTLDLNSWPDTSKVSLPSDLKINQISLIQSTIGDNKDIKHLYRISASPVQTDQDKLNNTNTREKRFKGQKKEKFAFYIDAVTGEQLGDLDSTLIQQQAKQLLNEQATVDLPAKLITHFGLGYDFRNKRLPVWRVEGENGQHVFIDPITHILVDQNNSAGRLEGYSFSFLHKWNMLTPLMGRFNRDMLILTTLALIFMLAGLGLILKLKTRKQLIKTNTKAKRFTHKKKAA